MREQRPKYVSLYAYIEGAPFAPSLTSLPAPGRPVNDKNQRGSRMVGR